MGEKFSKQTVLTKIRISSSCDPKVVKYKGVESLQRSAANSGKYNKLYIIQR